MSECNVEYIDENGQDSQTAYVNTATTFLVILTSGSVVDFYPRCNAPFGPVWVCRMMALRNAKCENSTVIILTRMNIHLDDNIWLMPRIY